MFGFGKGRSRTRHYYGSDTYRQINKLLGKPGDILLISPYLDAYYARIIAAKSKGKEFYIISSSADRSAIRILKGGHPLLSLIWYTLLSAVFLYLLLFVGISGTYLIVSAIPFIAGLYKFSRGKPKVSLKIPKRFVHSKTYISDTMAITGSANLTYAGTHMNIEQITIITDEEDIEGLKKEFWKVWKNL